MVDVAFAAPQPARRSMKPQRLSRGATSGPAVAPAIATQGRATVEDWLRIPEEERAELIHGRIVYHTFPDLKHGDTQAQISHFLRPYRGRSGGGGGGGGAAALGGWWLSQEVDMALADVGCRPDVVGWRRDKHARVPQADARGVVTETPDFLCEVLSPSTARYDKVEKLDAYFRAGVPYYWLVDPMLRTFTVLERTDRGYLIVRVAGPGETVRAAPFAGVEIPVDELFMDEEGELAVAPPAGEATPPVKGAAKKRASRRRQG